MGVEPDRTRSGPRLVSFERVRCLDCGSTYGKPIDGGTVTENPGCPRCGYLGWIAATVPAASRDGGPRRFAEDQHLRRASR